MVANGKGKDKETQRHESKEESSNRRSWTDGDQIQRNLQIPGRLFQKERTTDAIMGVQRRVNVKEKKRQDLPGSDFY